MWADENMRIAQRRESEEKGEGKDKMQENTEEQGLVREDNVSSISDAEERRVLEEELGWARLERQKILALSAEADDAIWHLASLARRRMQEREEARNQARMLLADLQARNPRMMALPGMSRSRVARPPDAFAATAGYEHNQALAFRPLGSSSTMMQEQPGSARAGTGYCAATSSGGYAYAVQPSLLGLASSSQDHFDPDMFLVDVAEPPQDVVPVPATADSSQGRSSGSGSGTYGQSYLGEQKALQWKR